ncbi:prostaglandin reductase-3-like isoform X1 [Mytilus galloprovincialis]|uniref:prostaglandin reductase-3-like isoform X1 n=2 Tax=Mytilus galloprovincialis TaxID=29158 RepID=UPI003F7B636B
MVSSMADLPSTYKKIVAVKFGTNFRDVTKVVDAPMPVPEEGQVLVKNRFVGINASDVNFTAGKYDSNAKLPFDCGFEGLGEVVAVGPGTSIAVGTPVMYMVYGAFSEYKVVPTNRLTKVKKIAPEYLPCQVSAGTAAISLDKLADLKSGETVFVSAAAGGTGQFAVQWAKKAGCHVIGTCSSPEKANFLKTLGCDRTINYKTENINEVLKAEYPNGLDVVYESVGGEMFETCFNNLKVRGRLVIIGYISKYGTDTSSQVMPFLASLPQKVLTKSLSILGFFLPHYPVEMFTFPGKIAEMYNNGQIKSLVDTGKKLPNGPFVGIDKVADAVEYLYTGKSLGKIVVEIK